MKLKACLILMFFILGENAFADIIEDPTQPSGRIVKPQSRAATSIVRSTSYENEVANYSYSYIIDDLIKKLNENPKDLSVLISLADAYLRYGAYDKLYEILLTIVKDDNDGFNEEQADMLKQLRKQMVKINNYENKDNYLLVSLPIVSAILSNSKQVVTDFKFVIPRCHENLLVNAITQVAYSIEPQDFISVCNFYANFKGNDPNILREKIIALCKIGNVSGAIKDYNTLSQEKDIVIGGYLKYYVFKVMSDNDYSEKEIISTLFPNESSDLEFCYYQLYDIASTFKDEELFSVYMQKLLKKFPDSVKASLVKIDQMLAQGQKEEAVTMLKELYTKVSDQEEVLACNVLSVIASLEPLQEIEKMIKQGYYQQALDILNSGSVLDSVVAYSFRARCYLELGQKEQAIENLNKAKAIELEAGEYNYVASIYYLKEGDYENAKIHADNAAAREYNPKDMNDLYSAIAQAQIGEYIQHIESAYDSQNYDEAMKLIEKALTIDSGYPDFYYYMGLVYIAQNNYAMATAPLLKTIQLVQNNANAYYYLGLVFDNLSEQENALYYYNQFVDLLPEDAFEDNEKLEYAKARINKIGAKE